MTTVAPPAAPPPPPAAFSIEASPFAAAGQDAVTMEQAILAATRPVEQLTAKRPREQGAPAGALPLHQQLAAAGKHRPPRPPSFAESRSLPLELPPGPQSPQQGGAGFRSPRSPAGATSPGRRPRQLSKTLGRVCIECGTSQTTQWRSQGLLCNSCGVKLIKGRLPMDPQAMERRWLRLPPAIKDHPMWAAAQVVAAAQGEAARSAALGEPWACPGCGREGQERVAGPCGLHHCPCCVTRYQLKSPPTGAAAVAAVVAAPPGGLLLTTGTRTPPAATPGSGHKRRKQAMPRSASAGLSPLSLSSSSGSSIQAYSWQSAQEAGQPDDVATSKERTPRRTRQGQHQHNLRQGGAAPVATPPPASAKAPPAGTPTAAEAAAALLVLTESDEMRMEAASEMDRQTAAAIAVAAGAAQAAAAAQQQQQHGAQQGSEQPSVQGRLPAADCGGAVAAAAGELVRLNSMPKRFHLATSLDMVMQLLHKNSGHAGMLAAYVAPPSIPPAPPVLAPATSDSLQLYQQLIAASATPEASAAGLTAELVGRYLAALTMPPPQAQGAGGSPSACGDAAAAARAQQEQQARLVGAMATERQYTAAVALMRSVVQLAGL